MILFVLFHPSLLLPPLSTLSVPLEERDEKLHTIRPRGPRRIRQQDQITGTLDVTTATNVSRPAHAADCEAPSLESCPFFQLKSARFTFHDTFLWLFTYRHDEIASKKRGNHNEDGAREHHR